MIDNIKLVVKEKSIIKGANAKSALRDVLNINIEINMAYANTAKMNEIIDNFETNNFCSQTLSFILINKNLPGLTILISSNNFFLDYSSSSQNSHDNDPSIYLAGLAINSFHVKFGIKPNFSCSISRHAKLLCSGIQDITPILS